VKLIFGGRRPAMHENSSEHRVVQTIFNRYNEVSAILADQPDAYRPIFMVDADGGIVARDWAVGFALGIGLRPDEWGKCILLTKHRQVLTPILVYCDPSIDLLPDMSAAEKRPRQVTAHAQIAQAVVAARDICNPYRAAEARQQPAPSNAQFASADSQPGIPSSLTLMVSAHRLRPNWRARTGFTQTRSTPGRSSCWTGRRAFSTAALRQRKERPARRRSIFCIGRSVS